MSSRKTGMISASSTIAWPRSAAAAGFRPDYFRNRLIVDAGVVLGAIGSPPARYFRRVSFSIHGHSAPQMPVHI